MTRGASMVGGLIGALAASVIGAAACSSSYGAEDDIEPEGGVVGSDAEERADVSADTSRVDASDGLPRSALVAVASGAYQIEATEVTVAQLRAFKARFGAQAGEPWTDCPQKLSLGPAPDCLGSTADGSPVSCVDYCDAKSYCAAIGRRLCGRIGGGRLAPDVANDATSDQWYRACVGVDGGAYPYGPAADPTACNTSEVDAGAPQVAEAFPHCEGGEPGIFDMSGNVAEWTDICLVDSNGSTACALRGDSFKSSTSTAACRSVTLAGSTQAFTDVGIRCCADP